MSIPIGSLYCNGHIDVLYDMMTQNIIYEPQETHEHCKTMNVYTKIFNVPNIHYPLHELGSMYVILQCCRGCNDVVFKSGNGEGCCILKTCKGNIKPKIHALTCKPYSEMPQINCDELDAMFLKQAQNLVKNIYTITT
jgi:hypothetical protein